MNDRELLELAAKAGGYEIIGWEMSCGVEIAILADLSRWQPLMKNESTDCMGDALRLAVKLHIDLHWSHLGYATAFQMPLRAAPTIRIDEYGADPCATTRRAIVRVAAEIGRAMS